MNLRTLASRLSSFLNDVVITQKRLVLPGGDHIAQGFVAQHVADGVDQLYRQFGMRIGKTAVAPLAQAPYPGSAGPLLWKLTQISPSLLPPGAAAAAARPRP